MTDPSGGVTVEPPLEFIESPTLNLYIVGFFPTPRGRFHQDCAMI